MTRPSFSGYCLALLPLFFAGCSPLPKPETTPVTDDRWRPTYHFTPPEQWMNDPNGMVYHAGEYHLFYQHYPDSNVWGPMHWGHAVSNDLIEWEHLPIALYPDTLGYIFSGSAVVDRKNTSGFGSEENPPLVAIFTHHDPEGEASGRDDFQVQSIAYSRDRGRNWTKYAGNPVVPNPDPPVRDFRDPKVIWDDNSGQWIMVFAARDRISFYGSPDLKEWTELSDWGTTRGSHEGIWECPDLFPVSTAGGDTYWVLLVSINGGGPNGGSATQYFVGDFADGRFTLDGQFAERLADEGPQWVDYGRDNYAGVTWSDVPREDGRRIFLGWMSNWQYARDVPTTSWRGAMTVPRSLELTATKEGPRLLSRPVRELSTLRGNEITVTPTQVTDRLALVEDTPLSVSELLLSLDLASGDARQIALVLANGAGDELRIGYDRTADQLYTDRRGAGRTDFQPDFATARHTAPRISSSDTLGLHVLLDRASLEVFADGGATVFTDIYFVDEPWTGARLETAGGAVSLLTATVFQLRDSNE
jgi:fructan beta-fructosidase